MNYNIFNNLPADPVTLIPLSQTPFLGHYSSLRGCEAEQVFRSSLILFSAAVGILSLDLEFP